MTARLGKPYPSIKALVTDQCLHRSDSPAIVDQRGRTWCYGQLGKTLEGANRALRQRGFDRDSRVALLMPAGAEQALVFLGIAASCTLVPLNPRLPQGDLIRSLLRTRAQALVSASPFLAEAQEIAKAMSVPLLEPVLTPQGMDLAGESVLAPLVASEQAIYQSREQTALVLHTSGSTAEPKLVPLTQGQVMQSACSLACSLGLGSDDRCLNMMPMFHIGALVDLILGPLQSGGVTIVGDDMSAASLRAGLEQKPTWLQGVPTMLENAQDVISHVDSSSLRFIRSVSAPLPVHLLESLEKTLKLPIIEIYGMTETAGLICSNPLPPGRRKAGSVGLPVDHEILVLDDVGNPCGAGVEGEILIHGPSVISGYEDYQAFNRGQFINGWLRSGDLGHQDADGYLFITGRKKDIINRGGEKISPAEIDRLLASHPQVKEAGAFGLAHPTLGEDVYAAVVLAPDAQVDVDDLTDFLRANLPDFKTPQRVFALDELPKNPAGKLDRAALRQRCVGQEHSRKDISEPPQSDLAMLIATMWKRALAVDKVGLQDNFFELGGDSLKAAEFIAELQDWLRDDSFFPSLFETPTVMEIEAELLRHRRSDAAELFAKEAGLSTDLYRQVRQAIASVKGSRRSPESLIIGRNRIGQRTPIFFSTGMEPDLLMELFGRDQPFYLMRSLLDLPCRSPANSLALAAHYAREINLLQPVDPLVLGGYCEGGKIAFEAARTLRQLGREVQLLFTIEQFIPECYDGSVSMHFAERSPFYPYRNFDHPQHGWRKYYSGDLAVTIHPLDHLDFLRKEPLAALWDRLQAEIDRSVDFSLDTHVIPRELGESADIQRFASDDRLCTLEYRAPRAVRPGASLELRIRITNSSASKWHSYDQSGLCLAARWVNENGRKTEVRARQKLHSDLEAGAEMTLCLRLRAPTKPGVWELDVDMLEDQVCLFQEVTYRRHTRQVIVSSPLHWPRLCLRARRAA